MKKDYCIVIISFETNTGKITDSKTHTSYNHINDVLPWPLRDEKKFNDIESELSVLGSCGKKHWECFYSKIKNGPKSVNQSIYTAKFHRSRIYRTI